MLEEMQASIAFYNINKCGYYTREGDFFESDVMTTFANLKHWIGSRENISETSLFAPREDSDDNTIYCYEILQKDTFLVTTWNGVATNDGKVSAINGLAKTGTSDLKQTNFPEGYIAGYPTYFWVLPRQNLFATIRFGKPQNGQAGFSQYILSFLAYHSDYIFMKDEPHEELLTTFSNKISKNDVNPYFQTTVGYRPTNIDAIRDNCTNITKVIYKASTKPLVVARDKALWQTMSRFLGFGENSVELLDVPMKVEIGAVLTEKRFDEIFQLWASSDSPYQDVGFVFKKSKRIKWLGKTLANCKIPLRVEKDDQGLVEASSLLNALEAYQERIIAHANLFKKNKMGTAPSLV